MEVAVLDPILPNWQIDNLDDMTFDYKAFDHLEKSLDYYFKDKPLVRQALSHASATAGKDVTKNYERLEFLGDRVLGLCVAELLYNIYPLDSEGDLAKRHSKLVSSETLIEIAKEWRLFDLIKAEEDDFALKRPSVMADAVESILAVIYQEEGLNGVTPVVNKFWFKRAQDMVEAPKDPKSALQEWTHQHGIGFPSYRVIDRKGPDHKPTFAVEVIVKTKDGPNVICVGSGTSRRRAELDAALIALMRIEEIRSKY